jgi:hypothetical protein
MDTNSVDVVSEMRKQWQVQFDNLKQELSGEQRKAEETQARIGQLVKELTAIDGALQASRAIAERLAGATNTVVPTDTPN